MTATKESNAWIPKQEGDTLEGEVIELVRGWSDVRTNGGRDMDRGWYPLLTIRQADGTEKLWHAFETVAFNRVLDKQPIPGETIRVTYLGESDKEPPKGMNRPKLYRLEVVGRDPAQEARTVYGQLGGSVPEPSAPPTSMYGAPDDEVPSED